MFRKIVTELAYSPTLVGNLGYYVKQLRDEASKRQIGLIFILLAITVQLIATMFPPESANANNPYTFIDGEIQSVQQYLTYYDQNTATVRDLLTSLGITRADIEAAELKNIPTSQSASIWLMDNPGTEDSSAHFFRVSNGKEGVAYYQPAHTELVGSKAYVGSASQLGGWFAVTKHGANLITEIPAQSNCSAWLASPGKPFEVNSWIKDDRCLSVIDPSLSVRKVSSHSSAIGQLQALDRIAYTLSVTNNGEDSIALTPAINLEDILEYSRILDYGSGEYDFDTKKLTWATTTLSAKSSFKRTFIVQLLPSIPATARGQHITTSYDCVMSISFGDSLATPVGCPITKRVEQIASNLPRLPRSFNIASATILLAIVTFLYVRARQQLSEIYIIRHNHLGGL